MNVERKYAERIAKSLGNRNPKWRVKAEGLLFNATVTVSVRGAGYLWQIGAGPNCMFPSGRILPKVKKIESVVKMHEETRHHPMM